MTKTDATRWKELSQGEENDRNQRRRSSVVGVDPGTSGSLIAAGVDSRYEGESDAGRRIRLQTTCGRYLVSRIDEEWTWIVEELRNECLNVVQALLLR